MEDFRDVEGGWKAKNMKLSQRDFDVAFLIFTYSENDQRKGNENEETTYEMKWHEIDCFALFKTKNTKSVDDTKGMKCEQMNTFWWAPNILGASSTNSLNSIWIKLRNEGGIV